MLTATMGYVQCIGRYIDCWPMKTRKHAVSAPMLGDIQWTEEPESLSTKDAPPKRSPKPTKAKAAPLTIRQQCQALRYQIESIRQARRLLADDDVVPSLFDTASEQLVVCTVAAYDIAIDELTMHLKTLQWTLGGGST